MSAENTAVYDFDLITIGAGSGGVAASRYAAAQGVRVAICEADRVGGTCVIRGCIPKKIFMYAAQFAESFADAPAYGWAAATHAFEMERLTGAKNAETERLEGIYRRMLSSSGVRLFAGRAQVADAHTVVVDGQRLSAGRILVATGAATARPPIPGIELALTSTELLDLRELPHRLLVLGSGYIALEFASIFRGLGSEVSLAFRAEAPLRGFDQDLRTRSATALRERGIDLRPGFKFARLERQAGGIVCHGADGQAVEADVVLNAMGRLPNSAGLGLEALGVKLDPGSGAVCVDAYSRSSVDSIFAVGDVTDRLALTPVAIAEGRAFVDTEFRGKPRRIDHSTVASAVFCLPPVACIGLTEAAARERGLRTTVFEADFRPMKNVISGRADRSYMKLVVDAASDRVLGVHMLGVDAPEIVQSLAVAVTMGATKQQFDATMAMHPTAAEEFMLMRTPRA
ncbi:MAG: glutathione-disulfide reductase [Nevskia sp.]|nr:glutathione-disulfide reductase [Nevskia sp.]